MLISLTNHVFVQGLSVLFFSPPEEQITAQHSLLFCQEKVQTAMRFIAVETCTHRKMQQLVGDVLPKRSSGGWNGFSGSGIYCFRDKKPLARTCYIGSNLEDIFENKALNNVNYLYIILEIILVAGI